MSYFAVPKCACTSLKTLFFEVENGKPWENLKVNGEGFWVHDVYPTLPFEKARKLSQPGFWRFAMIRNPVDRLISCYRNRLMTGVGHRQLHAKADKAKDMQLPLKPNFSEFVSHYESYCELAPDVRAHSRPLSFFLGRDPGYFNRLFRIEELGELMKELGARIGNLPVLQHLQTRGKNIPVDKIGSATEARIRALFDEDYRLFGAHF